MNSKKYLIGFIVLFCFAFLCMLGVLLAASNRKNKASEQAARENNQPEAFETIQEVKCGKNTLAAYNSVKLVLRVKNIREYLDTYRLEDPEDQDYLGVMKTLSTTGGLVQHDVEAVETQILGKCKDMENITESIIEQICMMQKYVMVDRIGELADLVHSDKIEEYDFYSNEIILDCDSYKAWGDMTATIDKKETLKEKPKEIEKNKRLATLKNYGNLVHVRILSAADTDDFLLPNYVEYKGFSASNKEYKLCGYLMESFEEGSSTKSCRVYTPNERPLGKSKTIKEALYEYTEE
ncbi:hypothetical protein ENBRE01_1724 [Enteropsectra breve]|nr:hypothetical protein ENBRE01_1020 [Enteropsectra breve]KAI5150808.1 hypothetical protein ENBRE01_1724 [Enteropsectra breve]